MLATITGCGYRHSELYPQDVRTVAVPVFDNRTPYREAEFMLTEALAKQIELRTPYKVTAESRAETILQGTIVSIHQRLQSVQRDTGVPQEMEVVMVVNFEWVRADGTLLRRQQGLEAAARYVPSRPVGEPLEVGQFGAIERVADQIVSAMRSNW